MKFFKTESVRFLIAGGINTLVTYLIYIAVLNIANYKAAFTLSFIAGIFIAYLLNSLFVFHSPISWRKMLQYPLVYILQYGAGLLVLTVLVDYFGIDRRLAPLLNVILLIPVTFTLNKWLLVRKNAL